MSSQKNNGEVQKQVIEVDPREYILEAYHRILQEQKERKPVLRLIEGENVVTIQLGEKWRKVKTRYGERIAIPAIDKYNNQVVLLLSERSKLYAQLIRELASIVKQYDTNSNEVDVVVSIHKVGKGIEASYDVKVVDVKVYKPRKQRTKKEEKGEGDSK
jgi:hypothetical protein